MYRLHTIIIILFLASTPFTYASTSSAKKSELATIVKQQQYLAKRVIEDYLTFQADQKNTKKKAKMKNTIHHFNINHLKLIRNKNNTKVITKKLKEVNKLWKIAYPLSQIQEHSKMLKTTMNIISVKMQELHKLYKKAHQ